MLSTKFTSQWFLVYSHSSTAKLELYIGENQGRKENPQYPLLGEKNVDLLTYKNRIELAT